MFSCKKEGNDQQTKIDVQFSFEMGGQLKSLKADTVANAAAVVVTVEDLTGKVLYNSERIDLYNMSGYYISKPISLVPGGYKLTKFLVVDKNNNVLYVTPMEGSPKAYLVTDPLPINFAVQKDKVTKVVPQVISAVGSTPQDFGYVTFSFDVVKTFDFLIGVFVYNENAQNFEMTAAHLTITTDSSSYQKDVPAATDTVTVKDGSSKYILTVTKDGYNTWVDTLTASELKLYYSSGDKGPLKVILEKYDCGCPSTVTDIDGNVYKTVKIGTQCWMTENLKTTRYNDGTPIANVTDSTKWSNLSSGAYCWYNNNTSYASTYGALYNWYAVNTGNLAPKGWHVPSDAEWTALLNYLGGGLIAGGNLKETGTLHWMSPNSEATNKSGFSGLPGGLRRDNSPEATFQGIGIMGYWWSTTLMDVGGADYKPESFGLAYMDGLVNEMWLNMTAGFSVRCIKD